MRFHVRFGNTAKPQKPQVGPEAYRVNETAVFRGRSLVAMKTSVVRSPN